MENVVHRVNKKENLVAHLNLNMTTDGDQLLTPTPWLLLNTPMDLYYKLAEDPESYWILYDLCLENNWAIMDQVLSPMLVGEASSSFLICKSYIGHIAYSTTNQYRFLSYCGRDLESRCGDQWYTEYDV